MYKELLKFCSWPSNLHDSQLKFPNYMSSKLTKFLGWWEGRRNVYKNRVTVCITDTAINSTFGPQDIWYFFFCKLVTQRFGSRDGANKSSQGDGAHTE